MMKKSRPKYFSLVALSRKFLLTPNKFPKFTQVQLEISNNVGAQVPCRGVADQSSIIESQSIIRSSSVLKIPCI